MLRRRDRGDRVHLQEAELPNRLEHRGRGAVEQLRADGDAPRAGEVGVRHAAMMWCCSMAISPRRASAIVISIGASPAGTPTGNQPRPTRTTISNPSSSPIGAKLSLR